MRGDLSETPAADACRELAARAATGTLTVDGPTGPGTVAFADGRITGGTSPRRRARIGDRLVGAGLLDDEVLTRTLAEQADAGSTDRLGALLVQRGHVSEDVVRSYVQDQVLDALFEILRWQEGPFEFVEGPPDADTGVPLSVAVDDALVEVARRRVEWDQLSQVIPDLDAIPTFRKGEGSASAGLEPDEFAVLASVDGSRSVRELADDLGYGEFEAARIVYSLTLLGVLDVQPAPPKPRVVSDDGPPAAHGAGEGPATKDESLVDGEAPGAAQELTADAGPAVAAPQDASATSDAEPADGAPDAGEPAPDGEAAVTAEGAPDAGEPAPDGEAADAEPTRGKRGGDVAEFMRELSRLAGDDAGKAKTADTAKAGGEERTPDKGAAPAGDQAKQGGKKKRRGLFGRGS
jgi:hypothetical protein